MKLIATLISTVILLIESTCGNAGLSDIPATDTAALVKAALVKNAGHLNFPTLVHQLYENKGYRFNWDAANNEKILNEALILLDCTSQYGLKREDFHHAQLDYDTQALLRPGKDPALRAPADILLTDALITLIVQLHFGKSNPNAPYHTIDKRAYDFNASRALELALESGHLAETIRDVQPVSKEYRGLQEYLRLSIAQYAGDCYEISDETVRDIALNLERLKWLDTASPVYISINIPSYTLTYHENGSSQEFKVIVGKPESPTPILKTGISELVTIPDIEIPARTFATDVLPKAVNDPAYLERSQITIYTKKDQLLLIPTPDALAMALKHPARYFARQSSGCDNSMGKLVFNFTGGTGIYLHDTPETRLFNLSRRALSKGCIRVENPEKLAECLLGLQVGSGQSYKGLADAMRKNKKLIYKLSNQVPVLITYNTTTLSNGVLEKHPDIYGLDAVLANTLFR